MAVVEVLKYNGSSDVFAWKYPSEELGATTQLIVKEEQEAVLMRGGYVFDVFEGGSHTLSPVNIPLLSGVLGIPPQGDVPFSAEVWFINKKFSLDIPWSVPTPLRLQDAVYGVGIPVQISGQFGLLIPDEYAVLRKLMGLMPVLDKVAISKYLRELWLTKLREYVFTFFADNGLSFLEMQENKDALITYLREKLVRECVVYDIEPVNFVLTELGVIEDDPVVLTLQNSLRQFQSIREAAKISLEAADASKQEAALAAQEAARAGQEEQLAREQSETYALALQEKEKQLQEVYAAMEEERAEWNAHIANLETMMQEQLQQALLEEEPEEEATPQEAEIVVIAMMECPRCHAIVEKGKHFCEACGRDLSILAQNARSDVVCHHCGSLIAPGTKFCALCGKRYDPCPECMADLEADAKECHICGFVFPVFCSACGKPVLHPDAKYCPECGVPLVQESFEAAAVTPEVTEVAPPEIIQAAQPEIAEGATE